MQTVRITRPGTWRPRTRPGAVMGDKAYSSAANRAYLRKRGIKAVIPSRGRPESPSSATAAALAVGRAAFDAGRYKERNTVERCSGKLKQFRAVATRYDKRELIYQGTVDLASIRIWLRDPVPVIHGTRSSGGQDLSASLADVIGPGLGDNVRLLKKTCSRHLRQPVPRPAPGPTPASLLHRRRGLALVITKMPRRRPGRAVRRRPGRWPGRRRRWPGRKCLPADARAAGPSPPGPDRTAPRARR